MHNYTLGLLYMRDASEALKGKVSKFRSLDYPGKILTQEWKKDIRFHIIEKETWAPPALGCRPF